MDEEEWEPMASVVGIPLPDDDPVEDLDAVSGRVSEEPEALSMDDLVEAELSDSDRAQDDELEVASGVAVPEPPPLPRAPAPPPPLPAIPPPPVPFAAKATPEKSMRSSFVDLDELLEEVVRDDSTRPVPFSPKSEPPPHAGEGGSRWPYALVALAAGVLVAYGLSKYGAPSDELASRSEASAPVGAALDATLGAPDATPEPPREAPAPTAAQEVRASEPVAAALDVAAPEVSAPEAAEPRAYTPRSGSAARRPRRGREPRAEDAREPRAETPRAPAQASTESAPAPRERPSAAAAAPASPVVAQPAPAPPASREDLPETPTREQVQAAFTRVLPNLRACTDSHGAVPIRVTISGSGRITTAVVQGHFAGTPEGSCLARAVRTARLPAFQRRRLNVNYPFVL